MSRKAVLERTLGKKAAKRHLPKAPKKSRETPVDFTLELPSSLVEQIISHELSKLLESLQHDAKRRKSGSGLPVFDHDPETDLAMLEGMAYSVRQVLEYYCTPDRLAELGLK